MILRYVTGLGINKLMHYISFKVTLVGHALKPKAAFYKRIYENAIHQTFQSVVNFLR